MQKKSILTSFTYDFSKNRFHSVWKQIKIKFTYVFLLNLALYSSQTSLSTANFFLGSNFRNFVLITKKTDTLKAAMKLKLIYSSVMNFKISLFNCVLEITNKNVFKEYYYKYVISLSTQARTLNVSTWTFCKDLMLYWQTISVGT